MISINRVSDISISSFSGSSISVSIGSNSISVSTLVIRNISIKSSSDNVWWH